jgi:hypothetical protein
MAESKPPGQGDRPPKAPTAGALATFVAALLAALGLRRLRDSLRKLRAGWQARRAAAGERRREKERAAEIARKRAMRHEPDGVRIAPLMTILVGSLIFAVIASVGLWALLYVLATGAQQADTPLSPLTTSQPLPPEPRLQVNPQADWQRVRATDEAQLSSYGQGAGGGVRIPIDRAMDLVAQRGLPARAGGTPDAGYDQAHDLESAGGQLAGVTPVPLGQGTGRPAATLAPQPTPTP